jgi:hypothetical protein
MLYGSASILRIFSNLLLAKFEDRNSIVDESSFWDYLTLKIKAL